MANIDVIDGAKKTPLEIIVYIRKKSAYLK